MAGRLDQGRLGRIRVEADEFCSSLAPRITPEEQYRALSGVFFDTLHEFILDHCDNGRFMTLLESVRGTWVFARKTLVAQITPEDLPLSYATSGPEVER